MSKTQTILTVFFFLVSGLLFAQTDHLPGEFIVQFQHKTTVEDIADRYREINGIDSKILEVKLLSEPFNMYKISIDPDANLDALFLRALKADREVSIAQFNHYVYPRESSNDESDLPNDPNFSSQWYHINDGSNGLEDADIDSDLAWEITTGGLTALGDTIVVCVIEGGNLEHIDLIDNAWFNFHEAPGDGEDNDENGYVDDFKGWNVQSQNDNGVYQGGHGTNVMGMIGAKGDNEIGLVGINWDIKIMSVAGENLYDESSIVEAYTYPLVQRKLYNETDGEKGAFVVATNASWGIDGGNPADYPVWSAVYDSLGVYGVLSCGATSNNNVNVDVYGDIPTAIDSDFLISVTATNSYDQRTFSGYGATTIDLAAPGQNVITTAGSSGTTVTSGTSFATPLTTGVIALLYSVPCMDFAQLAKDNPMLAASYVRHALLNGVDPLDNLTNETVTGGRLNAFNSLSIIMDDCQNDFCLPVFSIDYEVRNDSIYRFTWASSQDITTTLRYRKVDEEEWIYIENITADFIEIDTLELCTDYEFQAASDCSEVDGELNYTASVSLTSVGCCVASAIFATENITTTSVDLTWEPGFNIPEYEIYYRPVNTVEWIFAGSQTEGSYEVTSLDTCAVYEFLILPACTDDFSVGAVLEVQTKGCGFCIDQNYCVSKGDANDEYIKMFTIGEYTNQSNNNGGYLFVDDSDIELALGEEYDVSIVPGFSFFPYNENYRIWIDFNQNGEFDDDEIVFETNGGATSAANGSITIPPSILTGATRLRVSMAYAGFSNDKPLSCNSGFYGETEDYCVEIHSVISAGFIENSPLFNLYPNPSSGSFTLELHPDARLARTEITLTDVTGKIVYQAPVNEGKTKYNLSLPAGVYTASISHENQMMGARKLVITQ